MCHKKRLNLAISAALGVTLSVSIPAFSQDAQDYDDSDFLLEEVVVTGTRILTEDGFGRTSPVTVVAIEDISSFGLTRIEDVLNNLPQIVSSNTAFDVNGASGTASIDLRGLGVARTLVLINGRRMQAGGLTSLAPDLNQIPSAMIERVEVLTGGASATYGADAIAGVVNFIMRRMNGVEVSVGAGAYQHNNDNSYIQGLMDDRGYDYHSGNSGLDGKSYNVDIAIGSDFADGRGNATAFITWRQNEELRQDARDYSSCRLNAAGTACGGSANATVPNFFIAPLTGDGEGPYGYDYNQEEFLTLQPDNSLEEWDGSNVYNFAPVNHIMRPQERWSAGAFIDYEVNEHATAYMETLFAHNETNAQRAESGTFFAAVYPLPLSNSVFSEGFRADLASRFPGDEDFGIYIGKRNNEGGPRVTTFDFSSFRIVTGVKGKITDNWDYDVSYLHGQTASNSTSENDLLAPKIATAVDGELCAATPGCIPYEVFTYQGVTAQAAATLSGTAAATGDTSLDIINAYVTGDTGWGFAAGNIMVAGGFEWRQHDFNRTTDELYANQLLLGMGGPWLSLNGGYRVKELFVEGNIPLLADKSWAQKMVLDIAYRWSDYNTVGVTNTYRIGLDWQVVDAVRLRAGYNRAVRAPSFAAMFGDSNATLWTGTDPCAGSDPLYTQAQCALTGVTSGQYGNITPSPSGQYNGLLGGNPDLGVETANTYTVGLVISPLETMQLSIDYWDIRIDNVISSVAPGTILEQCGLFGSLCDAIQRSGNGSLWQGKAGYVESQAQNLGQKIWSGIDLAWAWDLGDNWRINLTGTYKLKMETTPVPNDPNTTFDDVGVYYPKWRHTFNTTYDSNSWWAVTARWRYYGTMDIESEIDALAEDELGSPFNYLDLNASFRFMQTHDVIVGVNNVFDKAPPLLGGAESGNGNTWQGYYDTLGRYLFANVTLRW